MRSTAVLLICVLILALSAPLSVAGASLDVAATPPATVTLRSEPLALPSPPWLSWFQTFDLDTGVIGTVDEPGTTFNGSWGDFYFYDNPFQGGQQFWSNNVGEQGVRDVTAGEPFTTQGVPVVLDHVYQVLVEPGFYGFFTVTATAPHQVTLAYSMVLAAGAGSQGNPSAQVVQSLARAASACAASAPSGYATTVACVDFIAQVMLAWVRPSPAF